MLLKRLTLSNFKIYHKSSLDFDAQVVCFAGPNGAGKTNLLDAIHYLCIGKSYFNPVDVQNIHHDENFFRVEGIFDMDNKKEVVVCVQERGKKKVLSKNKSTYDRLADHIGNFPVVMIAPDDLELINGGSEERRKFMDYILASADRIYLENLLQYNRLLSQRNALLKQFNERGFFDMPLLQIYNEKMIPLATVIYEARTKFIKSFIPVFNKIYEEISGGSEVPFLIYQSDLKEVDQKQLFNDTIEKDRHLLRTSSGIHKDDLKFKLDDFPVKKFGSQGQKKSFLIALKLAQYRFLADTTGKEPLLLLDDLFDKLDLHRAGHLLKITACGKFGQVFITDTQQERLASFFKEEKINFDLFKVKNGKIEQQDVQAQ